MRLILIGLLCSFPTLAHAGFVDFCVQYNVYYTDASTSVGDDHFTSNGAKKARGARLVIIDTTASTTKFDGNLEENGTDAGCAMDVMVVNSHNHTVKLFAEATLDTNTVEVLDDDDPVSGEQYTYTWTPSLVGLSEKKLTTSAAEQWNIMAAAGFALDRHDGGLSSETFTFYTEACPGGGVACVREETPGVFVGYLCLEADCSVAPAKAKYAITHQQGHLVMIAANGGSREVASSSAAAVGGCTGGTGHNVNHSEYQSRAATEGTADIWAAMTFNMVSSGADCGFKSVQAVDWDNDGSNNDQEFDCDGTLYGSIDGNDYLGDECDDEAHHGTQLDWLRFWWDMLTDESLDDDDVFAIWNEADPDTWETEDTPTNASYKPAARLDDAADTVLSTPNNWTTVAATNGTDR